MTVNVLGTEYKVITAKEDDIINNMEEIDGECNVFDKEIIIRDKKYIALDSHTNTGKDEAFDIVLRHEVAHAVMYESGFDKYDDEALVDWIARMLPKIEDIVSKLKNGGDEKEVKLYADAVETDL